MRPVSQPAMATFGGHPPRHRTSPWPFCPLWPCTSCDPVPAVTLYQLRPCTSCDPVPAV